MASGVDDDEQGPNPVDQLVELLVYAPIGLLYEYEDVLPKLVRRGRSQVQLARVMAQLAAKGSGNGHDRQPGIDLFNVASSIAARLVTGLGAEIGLSPTSRGTASANRDAAADGSSEPEAEPKVEPEAEVEAEPKVEPEAEVEVDADHVEVDPPLIEDYDDLTAREIIALLDDLDDTQRARIKDRELAGRGRKTVLAKLERLEARPKAGSDGDQ